ncbi:FAD-dependent oxidoreductase [soil metagenome]
MRTDPDPDNKLPPARYEQTFPELTAAEIARLERFGKHRHYADGEPLFRTGDPGQGMFVILTGRVVITSRDGLGRVHPVADQGEGQFVAEVGQLSGRATLVDGHAEGEVEVLVIDPEHLRALMVGEAELGERIMRALILRRVALISSGAGGPVLIDSPNSADRIRLENFLGRNGLPNTVLDPAEDADAREIVLRYAPTPAELPLVVTPNGDVLRNPSDIELAHALHMTSALDPATVYDVVVVGAGPAGLATAVYAASEGLCVAVVDARSYGGQAGASARIENYLGFPTGISGRALAGRAFVQAQKFGADIRIPACVKQLDCSRGNGHFALRFDDGDELHARTVVIASGARYRRPAIERLELYEGRGVWYWASPIEGKLCQQQTVVLVGGGNSAGQAAVYLASQAAKVIVVVRAGGLAATMSSYLVERIAGSENIEVRTGTEVVELKGTGRVEQIVLRERKSGRRTEVVSSNLFLFVGAEPATEWLKDCGVRLDAKQFVITGADFANPEDSANSTPLQTSVEGVFAVGDVRSGSVKRVGGAIGEGAQVVPALHRYLARVRTEPVTA